MLTALKVKLKTLSSEARHIKLEETRILRYGRWLIGKQSFRHGKGKVRPEAQNFNAEIEPMERLRRADEAYEKLWNLQDHRKGVLRKESRASFIAYGFLRGLEYSRIEHGAFNMPDWAAVERIALRFSEDSEQVVKQRLAQWLDEAKDYFDGRGNLNKSDEQAKAA